MVYTATMQNVERVRRLIAVILVIVVALAAAVASTQTQTTEPAPAANTRHIQDVAGVQTERAHDALEKLDVKGRAPKTNYAREQFSDGWAEVDGCDMRNYILARDMPSHIIDADDCRVNSGTLNDPYTGQTILFQRGSGSSSLVQIDHVVALSDAWQKGAQNIDEGLRAQFANDPLNLLAVDGATNQQKSDSDAASWLPPNTSYRCRYVARQIAVKLKYHLWVTAAERDAIAGVLQACPDQVLPIIDE
jgi:Protein of unknown function (DUF1524)